MRLLLLNTLIPIPVDTYPSQETGTWHIETGSDTLLPLRLKETRTRQNSIGRMIYHIKYIVFENCPYE